MTNLFEKAKLKKFLENYMNEDNEDIKTQLFNEIKKFNKKDITTQIESIKKQKAANNNAIKEVEEVADEIEGLMDLEELKRQADVDEAKQEEIRQKNQARAEAEAIRLKNEKIEEQKRMRSEELKKLEQQRVANKTIKKESRNLANKTRRQNVKMLKKGLQQQQIEAPKQQQIEAPKQQQIEVPKQQQIEVPKQQQIEVPNGDNMPPINVENSNVIHNDNSPILDVKQISQDISCEEEEINYIGIGINTTLYNNCYLNSAFQMLYHMCYFRNALISDVSSNLNYYRTIGTNESDAVYMLFTILSRYQIDSNNLKTAIARKELNNGYNYSPPEFVNDDMISIKMMRIPQPNNPSEDVQDDPTGVISNLLVSIDTIVNGLSNTYIFGMNTSTGDDNLIFPYIFTINLKNNNSSTLSDVIKNDSTSRTVRDPATGNNVIENVNYVENKLQEAFSPAFLLPSQKYLIFRLNRYKDNRTKNVASIIPNPILDLYGQRFLLKGVIIHIGNSVDFGHYIYITYNNGQNISGIYNNGRVTIINPDNSVIQLGEYGSILGKNKSIALPNENEIRMNHGGLVNKNGYIFLYEKTDVVVQPQPQPQAKPKTVPEICVQQAKKTPTNFDEACNVLGINLDFINDADPEKILNNAFRRMSKACHPDIFDKLKIPGLSEDEKKIYFQNIKNAYDILKDVLDNIPPPSTPSTPPSSPPSTPPSTPPTPPSSPSVDEAKFKKGIKEAKKVFDIPPERTVNKEDIYIIQNYLENDPTFKKEELKELKQLIKHVYTFLSNIPQPLTRDEPTIMDKIKKYFQGLSVDQKIELNKIADLFIDNPNLDEAVQLVKQAKEIALENIPRAILMAKKLLSIPSDSIVNKDEIKNRYIRLIMKIENNVTSDSVNLTNIVEKAYKILDVLPEKIINKPQIKDIQKYFIKLGFIEKTDLMTNSINFVREYKGLNFKDSTIILRPRMNNKTKKEISNKICTEIGKLNPIIISQKGIPSQIPNLTKKILTRRIDIQKKRNAESSKKGGKTTRKIIYVQKSKKSTRRH
jgi:hypothetical protein